MAEVIVFPDVEDELRVWLAGEVTADVYAAQKPATFPSTFVYLRRTGGSSVDLITDAAQVTVECYALTGSAAFALAAEVRGLLGSLEREGTTGTMTVHAVTEFSGPYLDPDPLQPERTRYTATYRVAVRGTVA